MTLRSSYILFFSNVGWTELATRTSEVFVVKVRSAEIWLTFAPSA